MLFLSLHEPNSETLWSCLPFSPFFQHTRNLASTVSFRLRPCFFPIWIKDILRNGWETCDKGEKMQLGAWGKKWTSTLIYHYWLAAEWERQRQRPRETGNNKWMQEKGWASLPGFSGSSIISVVVDGWLCHSYLHPAHQRISNCDRQSLVHSLFQKQCIFSPCTRCLRAGALLSDVSIAFTLRKVCFHDANHSLRSGLASPSSFSGQALAACPPCSLHPRSW